jgi:hypothetical protein
MVLQARAAGEACTPMILIHGRGASAADIMRPSAPSSYTLAFCSWLRGPPEGLVPESVHRTAETNGPSSSALGAVGAVLSSIESGPPPGSSSRASRGACLTRSSRRTRRYGGSSG